MSVISDFTDDPCEFLEQNIVLQMVPGTGPVGATAEFTLKPSARPGFSFDGGACPVYEMHEASAGERFTAYWCPYENEKSRSLTLGGAADLMFTAKMDGCSFGVGMPGIDGSVRVAHANLQETDALSGIGDEMFGAFDPTGKDESKRAQMLFLHAKKTSVKTQEQGALLVGATGVNGALSTEINPSLYRGLILLTFGIRNPFGDWRFYFHGFKSEGNKYINYGVFPFAKVKPRRF